MDEERSIVCRRPLAGAPGRAAGVVPELVDVDRRQRSRDDEIMLGRGALTGSAAEDEEIGPR